MKRSIVFLIFILLLYSRILAQCSYDNTTTKLGIGLVEYDIFNHKPPTLEVFNNSELTEKLFSWKIYNDESPFCAKFHKPDYGIAQIIVIDTLKQCYKVLINENDIKYIPRNIDYVFQSWEEYLTNSLGVRRREISHFKDQPIRLSLNDSSKIVNLPDEKFEMLCVLELKGDWIKIKYDCFYNLENNTNEGQPCKEYIDNCNDSNIGWLKWKFESQVAVDIFLIP